VAAAALVATSVGALLHAADQPELQRLRAEFDGGHAADR